MRWDGMTYYWMDGREEGRKESNVNQFSSLRGFVVIFQFATGIDICVLTCIYLLSVQRNCALAINLHCEGCRIGLTNTSNAFAAAAVSGRADDVLVGLRLPAGFCARERLQAASSSSESACVCVCRNAGCSPRSNIKTKPTGPYKER